MKKLRIAVLCGLLGGMMAMAGCPTKKKPPLGVKAEGALLATDGLSAGAPVIRGGLTFRLAEGQSPHGPAANNPLDPGTPLSAADTKSLLARVPALAMKAGDQTAFAFRARSLPPPRTGKTVKGVFPPPVKPPVVDVKKGGPLKVLRGSPVGDVLMAPKLSVTFNQPMVAVTSHADTIAKGVPVTLTPALKGQWRWIGTRTLLFETKLRFPMATKFTATVPAGTKSANGGTLAEAKSWSFATPAPRLIQSYPSYGPQRLDPVFFIGFDQKIDPDRVLAKVTLQAGGKKLALQRASKARLDGDKRIAALVKASERAKHKSRWVAFVATERLTPGTSYTVSVGEGTPSAEGPLTTKKAQTFSFKTYDPLKVRWQNCKEKYPCRPPSSLMMRFNNPLDEKLFKAKTIAVTPKIPEMQIVARGSSLYVYGRIKGRTTYKVTLPAALQDTFGQTLGAAETRSFHFKEAAPRLMSNYRGMVVLDPKGDKVFRVHSINHKQLRVTIRRVKPSDWSAYLDYQRKYRWNKNVPPMPGRLIQSKTIDVKGSPDQMKETVIPLKKGLNKQRHGQLVVQVSNWPLPEKRYKRQYVLSWVQATDLAVDAFVDHTHLLGWVTRLSNGKPVSGAKLSIQPTGVTGKSGADGLGKLALAAYNKDHKRRVLVAQTATDSVLLPESRYHWGSGYWYKRTKPGESLRWFVFDDRKLYKPKEEVRLKGWVRLVDMGASGRIRLVAQAGQKVTWTVFGPRGNKVANGTSEINVLGGFDLKFKLADNVNLGHARVTLSTSAAVSGNYHTHRFRIAEFKRPEFEVSTQASAGPHMIGKHADVQIKASYFAGGGLPGAKVQWRVAANKGHYTPPNRSGWTFVGWRPSWGRKTPVKSNTESFSGVTDSRGAHRLRIHFDAVDPPRPMSVRATATITDVNRRTWTATKSLVVHPSKLYVGMRTKKYFVKKGQPLKVEVIVTDLKGKAVAGRVVGVQAVRQQWRYVKRKWRRVERDPQNCRLVSGKDPGKCVFKTPKGGSYIIRARVTDADGKPNRTTMTRYVSGGKLPPKHKIEKEKVRLVAGKKKYQPGETAEILVLAPFFPAEGLMTVRRAGLAQVKRFTMKSASTTIHVPIKESHYPSLRVRVDLVGAAARLDKNGEPVAKLPKRPAYASGDVSLPVPPLKRSLKVVVTPGKKSLAPGGKTSLGVTLTDADGKPVAGAEVALVAVDESVLALTGYKLYSPLRNFHPYRSGGVRDSYLRALVQLMDPAELAKKLGNLAPGGPRQRAMERKEGSRGLSDSAAPAPSTTGAARPRRRAGRSSAKRSRAKGKKQPAPAPTPGQPIAVRKNFTPLALFAPAVKTDAAGKAQLELKVPDNLTRYRVMAVAVAKATHYGYGEVSVTARNPLMLRPAAPRFLNFGDRFSLPIVVQNQTDQAMKVKVAVRGTNVKWAGGQGKLISIPANDRREVRFQAETVMAGTARFQVAAATGSFADAAQIKLPVWTPATTEAFATYGTIDKGATIQPVSMPKNVIKAFGGLEITTSSTALQALTDAVVYIYSYPYECSEQISSRVLAVAALRDVLSSFKAKGLPKAGAIKVAMTRDMRRLRNMQNDDGGWGFWRRYQRSWPFLSIHVAHALVRAKAKGFVVPSRMYTNALNHIKDIERHIPSTYGQHIRRVIVAYSVYVRALAGDADVAKALSTYRWFKAQKAEALEAIGWLYPVLSGAPTAKKEIAEIRKDLNNRVTETAGAAHFRTSYSDGAHLILYSDRRVDGVLLEGLIKDQPKSDLIPKIVRGLLGHRKRGRWANTQENVWVLLALDKYFNTYEKTTPNFVARVWLGDQFAGQHRFAGRTTERHRVDIPMKLLGAPGKQQGLVVDKKGAGRLYYRIGMRYAPADLRPPPANHGFTVQRRYEAVDKPTDVRRLKNGVWQVKAGARVRVVVTMVAHSRRYHVALVDPLPAGLEAINTSLRGAAPVPKVQAKRSFRRGGRYRHMGRRGRMSRRHYWGWWRRAWFEHQNLRDERAEAFTSYLRAGVHVYKYVTRALTPGTFVVPPAKAEEMYHPETFGRSAGDKLIVK